MIERDADAVSALAPSGELRVAIAVGKAKSAVWTMPDPDTGEPEGVTVDLARAIASRLDVPLRLVELGSSGAIIASANEGTWDLSFTPVDAERKLAVLFGPDFYRGESTYLVPAGSPIRTIDEVDRDGVRVVGVEDTATIRSARRSLANTSVAGVAGIDDALALFREGRADALALGTESLRSLLPGFPSARILDGHFHAAGTAIAVPLGHEEALAAATEMIEALKADGTVRRAFDTHGMAAAEVAPPGGYS
ncbi:transporter substrate-binding domain-containing protein [Marinivivus vitaminiproducens]|uniref:transporter substrate-binding domain-containing protein n=1 Tax=Marinivivus vitaminiproducens TaxID=3035935 RepID=UPI0027A93347|nr:transporter substrate-binding domain-containing protein [Geminicoccaceae bacterium SCSIO 64248]